MTLPVVRVRALAATLGTLAALLAAAGLALALEPHAPIKVTSNVDLESFPGRGTRSNPYVIEGYEIAATQSHGVSITGTSAHVVLRDLRIANGGTTYDGIALASVTNVTVEDTSLEGNLNGVSVRTSSDVVIQRVNVNSTSVGVALEASTRVQVRDVVFPKGERGVQLKASANNTFLRNHITLASGQFGFWFADNRSLWNSIDTSNVVNGVPMRWYVDVDGPFTVKDARVDLKGITNVAQMLVYHSNDVRIEDAILLNGTARGLLVERSEVVTVEGTNASLNGGHGVHVASSKRVRFLDGAASLNGGDGIRVEQPKAEEALVTAVTVGRTAAIGNRGTGVALLNPGPSANVLDVEARGNGAGILVANAHEALAVADNRVATNEGHGIEVRATGEKAFVTGNVVEGNKGDGVRFMRAGGGATVRGNVVEDNRGRGVVLERIAPNLTVAENRIVANGNVGLRLASTWRTLIVDNAIEAHDKGIELQNASRNSFYRNDIVKAERQTALFFADAYSYDNQVAPNNTANGEPLQWRVGIAGTEERPIVLADLRVEVANATNVAQIALHNSSWVRLVRPLAANGSAVGILLAQSHDVRVEDADVHGNAGSGIVVRSSSTLDATRGSGNTIVRANVTGNGGAAGEAGIKVLGAAVSGNVIRDSNISGNAPAGIRLEQTGARNVVDGNRIHANEKVGIVFHRATLTTVEGNTIGNHSRDVEFAESVSNLFRANALAIDNGSFGLFFRDELSYSNDIQPSTTVNGVAMQWFTFVEGREGTPVVLRPAPVELRGITNVAQVMLFKSSWVTMEGVVAANGTARGVYLVKSTDVEMANATARDSAVGIGLAQTLASRVADARATGNQVGVFLNGSSGNTVARAVTAGTNVSVVLSSSEGNRVWGVNATGAGSKVVNDATFVAGTPNVGRNLVVDAGLDRTVDPDARFTLSDAIAVSSFRDEPVVRQKWDFGDGTVVEVANADVSRPSHSFGTPGRHVVRFTVTTPSATYEDDLVVTVTGSTADGLEVDMICDPSTIESVVGEEVTFRCEASLESGEPGPFVVLVKEKRDEVANVTVDLKPAGNTTFTFSYTANATGDHLLRVGTETVVHVVASDAPPEEDGSFLPLAVWAAPAAFAVATWLRRR